MSGKSLYLYPLAENIEISEQDFYLSKKLQRYVKDERAVIIQEDRVYGESQVNALQGLETYERGQAFSTSDNNSLSSNSKKNKKKQKSSEE